MSESNIMMVDPNEIVIDMPVDEQNVLQKMESMKDRGIIQPVTLWLQGMRVIDGFHRSVAAQRLGWKEIPCYVVDCNEDAFWDARIQSARQHHRIESERLNTWILESWKTTEWYKPEEIDNELLQVYPVGDKEFLIGMLSVLDTLWTLYEKDGKSKTNPDFRDFRDAMISKMNPMPKLIAESFSDDNSPQKVNAKLVEWVRSKAMRWGISEREIIEKIFSFYPKMFLSGDQYDHALNKVARDLDLSFTQRQKLASKIDLPSSHWYFKKNEFGNVLDDWAKDQVKNSFATKNPSLSNYVRDKVIAKEELQERQVKEQQKSVLDRERFLQTPQGQAEAHKRKVQTVKEAMDRVVWAAESIKHLISDSQDFSLPVAEAIATLTDFHNAHFKRKDTKMKDLITAKNAQLRREIKALNDQVASLKRALEAKQVATPKLRNVMVEHSE